MKIVIGKFSSEPFHALSKKDVSLLLKLVPKEWANQISSVVLSSKIFNKSKLSKPVEFLAATKQLNIYSRGQGRDDIARQVLYEMAAIIAKNESIKPLNTDDLDEVTKLYFEKFIKQSARRLGVSIKKR